MRRWASMFLAVMAGAGMLGGCSDDDTPSGADAVTTSGPGADTDPHTIAVTGTEYAFEVPPTVDGGLVRFEFTNAGKEGHFAGLARVADGKTFEETKAVLSAAPPTTPPAGPPAGPPPFTETAGVALTDPGTGGNATFNLPAGNYALFCSLPAADGVPHAAKGMIVPLTVQEGRAGRLPETMAILTATDFTLAGAPELPAGTSVAGIRNEGRQLHEINLVELGEGTTTVEMVKWFQQPAGPPPMRFLAGAAIQPGEEATTNLTLTEGSRYALICAIPDALGGDFLPHVVKGMFTAEFTAG